MENNIIKKAVNAAKWTTITEILAKLIAPITNMILARILAPEAFGVLATVTMIIAFADMFKDAGFQKYLIQHDFHNEEEKYKNANVAFWTNLMISTFLCFMIILFRKPVASLAGSPELDTVIGFSGLVLLATAFSGIQLALYKRDMNFKTLFMVRMITICVPFVITIPLAFLGFGFWSLIAGEFLTQIVNAVILTAASKWRPAFYYSFKILKEMFSFSMWTLLETISIWFSFYMDIFIIGKLFSNYHLGLYKTSITMVHSIMNLIVSSTIPVFFSAMSRLKNDERQFMKVFFKTQRLVSILVFPLGMGIYLQSELATEILLGKDWSNASSIVGIFALANSLLTVIGYYCSEVYRALGRPRLSLLVQLLNLAILIPVCLISSSYGFWVFVYTRAGAVLWFVMVHFIIMKTSVGVPFSKILKNILPTLTSALGMGFFGFLLQNISSGYLWNFVSILLCALFYLLMLNLFPLMRLELEGIYLTVKYKLLCIYMKKNVYKESNETLR